MKILFLTQYYPPETGASQNRLSDLAGRLAGAGHAITVVTAMPNYPEGEIRPGYRGRWLIEEDSDQVRVIRTWIYATRSKKFFLRLTNYFSFVLTSLIGALIKVRSCDIVVVESPPLFLGLSGLVLGKLLRAKVVFNVSDLWPRSAIDLGVLRNRTLVRLSVGLEEFIYRNSDLITGQTRGIVSDIQRRVSTPVLLYTNGADTSQVSGAWDRKATRLRFGLNPDAFLVGFAGLHGLVYDLDAILLAAEKLSTRENIVFAFFGDGPEKLRLQELAKEKELDNVRFFPPQPRESMPEIVGTFDISIAALKRLDLFKGTLPAKLFESLGAGVPVVFAIEGEAQELVEQAGGGICVPPQDYDSLAEAIGFLEGRRDLLLTMGRNGRQFIAANYDRSTIAKRVEEALLRLLPVTPAVTPHAVAEGS